MEEILKTQETEESSIDAQIDAMYEARGSDEESSCVPENIIAVDEQEHTCIHRGCVCGQKEDRPKAESALAGFAIVGFVGSVALGIWSDPLGEAILRKLSIQMSQETANALCLVGMIFGSLMLILGCIIAKRIDSEYSLLREIIALDIGDDDAGEEDI